MITRRRLLRTAALGGTGLALSGCKLFDPLRDRDSAFRAFMQDAQWLTMKTQRALLGENSLAKEYDRSQIRQGQRPNGSTSPRAPEYRALAANGFADWRLSVTGGGTPLSLSLSDLRAMPVRSQVTRHDCVEGWSTIAEWTGTPLSAVLDAAGIGGRDGYVLFRCFDELGGPGETYYETIDMVDARHPQTILAWGLNGQDLPIANGAPLRVRVERQLGYKMAKYISGIEVVPSFGGIRGGRGGFWEDRGYAWYAGI